MRPALFCDRDGNLIVEKNYISDADQVELIPGTVAALRRAKAAGYLLIVVTNQSGIARGLLTLQQAHEVNERLIINLHQQGVELDAVYLCPHHPDMSGPCDCRKPARGMVDQACAEFQIDLGKSYVIGDRIPDMMLARNIGATGIMVRTGYGSEESLLLPEPLKTTIVVESFEHAVNLILDNEMSEGFDR